MKAIGDWIINEDETDCQIFSEIEVCADFNFRNKASCHWPRPAWSAFL